MQIAQDTVLEFARLGIVYAHLVACCVAIGLVLTSDIAMVRQLMKGDTSRMDMRHMRSLQTTVSAALIALWATGVAVVALDMSTKGWAYLANPKIQAKVLIVVLLTLNGVVLHHVVLPWMQKAGSLLRLPPGRTLFAIFAGATSGVSWLYAAMLGVGRPLSWKYSLLELMVAYPLLIACGFMAMLAVTLLGTYRANEPSRSDAEAPFGRAMAA